MPLVETPEMFETEPLMSSASDAAAVAKAAASTAASGFGGGGNDLALLEGGGGGGEFVPAPADPDAPQCRICYGQDDDMCGENGRLFRPCRCKGSVQFVHVECLQRWRRTSANPRSFYRCDMFHYEYKFAKVFNAYASPLTLARWIGLPGVTIALSVAILFAMVTALGFFYTLFTPGASSVSYTHLTLPTIYSV